LSTIVITISQRGFKSVEWKEIDSHVGPENPRQIMVIADPACGKAEDGGG
jgi:hypothetical protein